MSFIINYGTTARNKLAEIEVHEKYKSTLLYLNKEPESANLKLQKVNAELQAAVQEKENFILQFSHEIRNPLNSLQVTLCEKKLFEFVNAVVTNKIIPKPFNFARPHHLN